LALELAAKHRVCIVGQIEQPVPARDNLSVTTIRAPLARWRSLYSGQNVVLATVHRTGLVFSILYSALIADLRERFDIVYARHGIPSLAGALLSRLINIPVVVELNGLLDSEAEIFHWPKLARHLTKLIEIFVFHTANAVVTVTKEGRNEVVTRFNFEGDMVTVVPNGVDTHLFRPRNKNDARRACKITPKRKVVCFVGNLMPWQGLENLIAAAPTILERFPETLFVVVGDGPQKRELSLLVDSVRISRAFYFAGKVPHTKVPNYVNSADVCVAPSKHYGIGLSPLKLFEYMSCGKPVVASDISGVGELLTI
jgi:glycosyltransferase involved in cell wall biosynthesis